MLEHWGDKAIVTNALTGKHYSTSPIALEKAKAQMRILETAEEKKADPPMEEPRRWIQEVVTSPSFKKGAFTRQAKARGESPKELMKDVLKHPEDYSLKTRRRAQFMANIQKKD